MVEALSEDLAKSEDEIEALRAELAGTGSQSARLAERLEAAEALAVTLSQDRDAAVARADAMGQELAGTRQTVEALQSALQLAVEEAERTTDELTASLRRAQEQADKSGLADRRLETLASTLAATQAELESLRTSARQVAQERDLLLEAIEGWQAESESLHASLAAQSAQSAQSDTNTRDAGKDALLGVAPLGSGGDTKLATAGNPLSSVMARGDRLLEGGDIASARRLYEQAANQGYAPGMTALGRTYDPGFLREKGIGGDFADAKAAASWYERAIATGDSQAQAELQSLLSAAKN